MLNIGMKKSNLVIFIIIVAALLALNRYTMIYDNALVTETPELINRNHVSSQRLFDNVWEEIQNNYYDQDLNKQDWYRWKARYHGKIKNDDDARVAIDTMIASLDDPYSRFMSKDEYSDQNNSIKSKITGIGVNISSISGKINIINVIEGSPAQSANLLPDDIIIAVDGKDINGMSIADVANLVRGPENSTVELTILRNNDKLVKKIVRREIKIKTVKSSIDKNIGYIKINTFIGSSTPSEFLEALEKTKNTEGLIIDLRGNTGGLLPNAVFIANLFIKEGRLVSIVGRKGYKYDITAQNSGEIIDKPLAVLVDGTSASASEILSGALKDYHKAKLIGTRTYGKGMVQKIIPLPNETGLNLTIAKYLTPNGTDINKKGIEPDINISFTINDLKNKNDAQLNAAKNYLSRLLSQKN